MLKTFSLLAMCFMMTLTLQAVGICDPQDGPQASASNTASTCVPIESWVHPAFERLAAEGYLPAAFFSLRPWTRLDCARLVDEAEDPVDDDEEQFAAKPAASDVPALLTKPERRVCGRTSAASRRTQTEGLLSPHHHDLTFQGFFYFNVHYFSGYTNNRQLIGSWIGREADGEQTWATWHLSPHCSLEVSGCSMTVDREFLRGGTLRDLRATKIALRPEWQLPLEEQTEWRRFPLLSADPQHDAAFTLQLPYRPIGRTRQ